MRTLPFVLAILGVAGAACGSKEEPPAESTEPLVGVLELPISLRNEGAVGADAARIEIAPSALRLDARTLFALESGRIPDAERAGDVLPKLQEALQTGAARRTGAIRMHVNTPLATLVAILATIKAANIQQIAFEVRKGGTIETGWLTLTSVRVEPPGRDPIRFEGVGARGWDEMVAAWEEAYAACRREHYVDCTPKPTTPAAGGMLALTFFARQSAIKAEFTRIPPEGEAAEAAPRAAPQMLDGVPAPMPAEGGEEAPPPVDGGAFTWRFEAATQATLSPVSGAFRGLCGSQACGVELTGETETLALRLISFLGAAFPNGTVEPAVAFRLR